MHSYTFDMFPKLLCSVRFVNLPRFATLFSFWDLPTCVYPVIYVGYGLLADVIKKSFVFVSLQVKSDTNASASYELCCCTGDHCNAHAYEYAHGNLLSPRPDAPEHGVRRKPKHGSAAYWRLGVLAFLFAIVAVLVGILLWQKARRKAAAAGERSVADEYSYRQLTADLDV